MVVLLYTCWKRFNSRIMGVLMFNDTFNNILFTLWRSVLFVEETGISEENQTHVAIHWQTLSHNVINEHTSPCGGFEPTTLVVIGTDGISSYKSNYHAITTSAPTIFQLYRVGQYYDRPATRDWQTWSYNVIANAPRYERDSNPLFSGDTQWL